MKSSIIIQCLGILFLDMDNTAAFFSCILMCLIHSNALEEGEWTRCFFSVVVVSFINDNTLRL